DLPVMRQGLFGARHHLAQRLAVVMKRHHVPGVTDYERCRVEFLAHGPLCECLQKLGMDRAAEEPKYQTVDIRPRRINPHNFTSSLLVDATPMRFRGRL